MTTFTTEDRKQAQKLIDECSGEPVPFAGWVKNDVSYCCHKCFKESGGTLMNQMILCGECGNKRCPKATDHELRCTGSNETGQEGSIYK